MNAGLVSRREHGRRTSGEAEVGEDAGDDSTVDDRRDDAHAAAAGWTLEDVDPEDALHELRPGEATCAGEALDVWRKRSGRSSGRTGRPLLCIARGGDSSAGT